MERDKITVEDCIEMYYRKGQAVILENGQVTGFIEAQEEK